MPETAPCPRCPFCGYKHTRTSASTLRAFFCPQCGREFEPEDDGFIPNGDPARIVEEAEQRQIKAREDRRREHRGMKGGPRR